MKNWTNVIENLIYIAFIGFIMIINTYVIIGQFEGMMETAIAKESTSIKNEFNTKINKLKARNGATLEFDITPRIDNEATTVIVKDSIPEKKGFFKRLFGKKDN